MKWNTEMIKWNNEMKCENKIKAKKSPFLNTSAHLIYVNIDPKRVESPTFKSFSFIWKITSARNYIIDTICQLHLLSSVFSSSQMHYSLLKPPLIKDTKNPKFTGQSETGSSFDSDTTWSIWQGICFNWSLDNTTVKQNL